MYKKPKRYNISRNQLLSQSQFSKTSTGNDLQNVMHTSSRGKTETGLPWITGKARHATQSTCSSDYLKMYMNHGTRPCLMLSFKSSLASTWGKIEDKNNCSERLHLVNFFFPSLFHFYLIFNYNDLIFLNTTRIKNLQCIQLPTLPRLRS